MKQGSLGNLTFRKLLDTLLQAGGELFHITVLTISFGTVGSEVSDKGLHCLTLIQQFLDISTGTLKALNKTIHHMTVSDIRRFKDGPQKCCIQKKMYRLYRKKWLLMVILLYNIYIFVWIQHRCLTNTVFALGPSNFLYYKEVW